MQCKGSVAEKLTKARLTIQRGEREADEGEKVRGTVSAEATLPTSTNKLG